MKTLFTNSATTNPTLMAPIYTIENNLKITPSVFLKDTSYFLYSYTPVEDRCIMGSSIAYRRPVGRVGGRRPVLRQELNFVISCPIDVTLCVCFSTFLDTSVSDYKQTDTRTHRETQTYQDTGKIIFVTVIRLNKIES